MDSHFILLHHHIVLWHVAPHLPNFTPKPSSRLKQIHRASFHVVCQQLALISVVTLSPTDGTLHDTNWIIIFFFIHIDAFGLEKVEESSHEKFFTGGRSLAKQASEPSESILRYQPIFLGVNIYLSGLALFHSILNTKILTTVQESRQSESICKSYATQKLTFQFHTYSFVGCRFSPIIHGKWASHMFVM